MFNQGAAGLVVVLPITSKEKGIPFHVEIAPNEGGLRVKSFIKRIFDRSQ
jgi:mRNA interferase MazF